MREHLSHPLILSASHSGSMPLLSAPPFDPCLMRVLDHQYSNYITWKRGTTLFLSSSFLQCNPSASLTLSFLMHCLCFFYSLQQYLSYNLFQFAFDTLALYLLALQILSPTPSGLCTIKFIFSKLCIICFTESSFIHLLHSLPIKVLLLCKAYSVKTSYQ